jgi:heparan-alpha-glucosaminide N-acetyltransferase
MVAVPMSSEIRATGAEGPAQSLRITSIDALRGLVMFTMIFVNDIAGAPDSVVPPWLKHFHGKSGMTFVDLVFPAFLFIVGMSIPCAIGSRLRKGQPVWRIVAHILVRVLSLLFIGVLMVNEVPDSARMGWSGTLWSVLMYLSAILAFCSISAPTQSGFLGRHPRAFALASLGLRAVGLFALGFLAFAFRGADGHRIVSLSPFSLHTEWYGILGLIGWAYLVGAVVYLVFRGHRTALLGCFVLLMCLYPADRSGAFEGFWLAHYVGIGGMLGSHAAITVGGILVATCLVQPETASVWWRVRFTLWFVAGCAAAAWLLGGLYGINKNQATPSWCLWACAVTAGVWLAFYLLENAGGGSWITRPLVVAGQNVLLAYLLSECLPSVLDLLQVGTWYGRLAEPGLAWAVGRSAGCAVLILCVTAGLNRAGFRLKL